MSHKKKADRLAKRNRRQYKLITSLREDVDILSASFKQVHELNQHHLENISNLISDRDDAICRADFAEHEHQEVVELANASIRELEHRLATIDVEALRWAKQQEVTTRAESVARVAGSRNDAVELFFSDMLSGKYDLPGTMPVPTILQDLSDDEFNQLVESSWLDA